jgi:hypothetical protein
MKQIKTTIFRRTVLVLLPVLLLTTLFSAALPQHVAADTQNNALLLVGNHCHDLNSIGYDFGNNLGVGGTSSCSTKGSVYATSWEQILHDNLGCSDQLFYTHDFHTDKTDSSVTETKWYTKERSYKDCYNRAVNVYHFIADDNSICKGMKDGSDNFKQCTQEQGWLHNALGCDNSLFQKTDSSHWKIKPKAMSACKSQIDLVGNARIIIPDDTAKKGVPSPSQIKDSAVTPDTSNTNNGSSGSDSNPSCEASGFNLSWILCPVINGLADATDGLYTSLIQPLLATQPIDLVTPDKDPTHTFEIWSNFRIYGDVFLVIALLVVVFGESIGGGLIDAYTAKKVLPRLLIAAVLINISIYLVAFAVDITNILGFGIESLIEAPFKAAGNFKLSLHGLTSDLGVAALVGSGALIWTAGIAAALLEFLFLFLLIPAFLVFIAIMATLILRDGLIILLIISAPIAFALYCLPNTEKYFRQWWELLFKTLLVYPLIGIFFALGNVLSVTLSQSVGGLAKSFADIMAIAALFVPLFLIPYSFRIAGGILGRFHEFSTNARKKTQEAIKGQPNDQWSWRNRARMKVGAGVSQYQQRVIDRGEALGANRRRRVVGGIAGSGVFGNPDMRASRWNKVLNEVEESMSQSGRDNLRYAGAGYRLPAGDKAFDGSVSDHDRWYNSKNAEISQNMHDRAKRYFGFSPHGIGSSLEYTFRKAQTSEDLAAARESFTRNAVDNDWTGDEMVDVWAQATFPHKDKWLSEWHSMPVPTNGKSARGGVTFNDVSTDDSQLDKMVNEGHSTREQFRWSSVRAQDWHAMHKSMRGIESQIDGVRSGSVRIGDAAQVAAGSADISDRDYASNLKRYAKMSELVDGMARSGVATMGDDGEVVVSGANAEVQGVITAMSKNRRFGVTNAVDSTTGQVSATNRAIYDKQLARVPNPRTPGTTMEMRGAELDAYLRNPANWKTVAPDVSPDRTDIESRL